jgi:ATP synthase F1 complex assembly factor 2
MLGLPDDLGPAHAVGGDEALLLSRRSEGNPVSGLPHPPILVDKAQQFVNSLDAWNLAALYSACAESKSFFIGAAIIFEAAQRVRGNGSNRDVKWAVAAARVEEEFNIEAWGLVEGGHDYDRLNASIQMHSASFLAQTVAHSVVGD